MHISSMLFCIMQNCAKETLIHIFPHDRTVFEAWYYHQSLSNYRPYFVSVGSLLLFIDAADLVDGDLIKLVDR